MLFLNFLLKEKRIIYSFSSTNSSPGILTCLIVTAGLQSFSSSSKDKHTVPDG